MRRGSILLAVLALVLFPFFGLAQHAPFAIISDTHIGFQESVYSALIKMIDSDGVHFMIHTGDAIHKPGDTLQWAKFLKITGQGKVLHLAPGNHDIDDNESLGVFLKYFPRSFYSFYEGDTLFLILNTELPGQRARITGEQLSWLKKELERPFRYKFVFLHEPLFPVVRLHGLDFHRSERDELHQLFVRSGVTLVMAGHDHLYDRRTRDGITYVIAGGGGGLMPFFLQDRAFHHYVAGERVGEGYAFTVKDMHGKKRDQFSIVAQP